MSFHAGQTVWFKEGDRNHSGKIVTIDGEDCTVEVRTSGGLWRYCLKIDELSLPSVPTEVPKLVSAVNHPSHYNTGKIEVIDAIEDWKLGFSLGNAVKYIARAEHKGKQLEDLKKAAWYLAREIKRLEGK